HESLQRRWDRLVVGTEQIPARQRLPSWWSRWRGCERGGRVGPLCRGHDCRRLWIDVRGEGCRKRVGGEIEVGAFAPVSVGERNGHDRRSHEAAFELLKKFLLALAHVA